VKSLRESLSGWAPKGSIGDPLAEIGQRWPVLVGEKISAHTCPVSLERGVLTVATRSNIWSQELSFLAERVLAAIAAAHPGKVERLIFRVGRIAEPRPSGAPGRAASVRGRPRAAREPTADAAASLARFRADVEEHWRAKRDAGWKPCTRCGVPAPPSADEACGICAGERSSEATSAVMRLLYNAPLVGFERASDLVPGLDRKQFAAVRTRLLKRWWTVLQRAERDGKLTADGSERAIAQSYVMLKSGLSVDRLSPATVRNELGDALYAMLYENGRDKKKH